MESLVLGLVLIAAAVVMYLMSQSSRRLAFGATATELSSIADLLALHQSVAGEVGMGLFNQPVALQGRLECDQPLLSELGNTPCAAFRYRVERHWQEEYEDRDEHGNKRRRVRTGSDAVASNERRTPFWIRDQTGRLLVTPDGATLEMEKIVDRFESGNRSGLLHFGRFQLALGNLHRGGMRRTLGYRFREEVLPLDRTIYVLGSAVDHGGALGIARSTETAAPFLVSLKTREQVVHSARQTMIRTKYGAYACAPLGLLMVLIGLLRR